ncbi:MAG: tRNA (adenosine(37)-N6)-threonylcarbamoyltransferase complex transferase subunit TsaD [Candidatus Komeilibacteria bacterium]|nr:tRNA (adenosine(37)-N6)-threonylcarbamoyltransferase complex transferase subunit TsaD [Candidatus Komeilibacteria bacterium]
MKILSIESSCDETALAVLEIKNNNLSVLTELVSSQVKIHRQYGGVVPEVAARSHAEVLVPLLEATLKQGLKFKFGKNKIPNIDLITVTQGPGLVTSLQVGLEAAKILAYLWQKPLIGVSHLAGHIYSSWLKDLYLLKEKKVWPSLGLIISGGHTELVEVWGFGSARGIRQSRSFAKGGTIPRVKYKILGQTRDDAVGEAFDKVAKLLGLGYPGGPEVSKLSRQINDQGTINFPRPMIKDPSLDFSFSGLKTAVLYEVAKIKKITDKDKQNICASFQAAATEVIVAKTKKALNQKKYHHLFLGGGVAANQCLRAQLTKLAAELNIPIHLPELKYTGDNATMIGLAGYFQYQSLTAKQKLQLKSNWQKLEVKPNWNFS